MGGYTLGDVARICRVPRSRLRSWQRMRLIGPRRPPRAPDAQYEFGDLVCVKRLVSLLEQGVPLRRIRRSVESLREQMPEVERPLEALRVWHAGSSRVVVQLRGRLVEPEGQLVLDLESDAARRTPVARLEPEGGGPQGTRREEAGDDAEAWFQRGCKLDVERATWGEALEAYRRALEIDPAFADAHCNLGTVLYNQNRKGLARESFLRALEIEPEHVEARLNLATLCEEEGRPESALRHYKRALAADPLCADTHVSLALLYERLELPRHARSHWRSYLRLDPSGTWAEAARRHLED